MAYTDTAAYLTLGPGELRERARRAVDGLKSCRSCPRNCRVDRLANERSVCRSGRYAEVSSAFPHFGEEDCLRGYGGSGTIFFARCNLRCVFCQNADISQPRGGRSGAAGSRPEEIASAMLALQRAGCHNINLVTPEHVVPQALEALVLAVEQGLTLPIVYNTSAYDGLASLQLLDGIVDIYMPDFKLWSRSTSERYLRASDYPDVARQAIAEMHRQVGPLRIDSDGIARRGVLIRHLVMPGLIDETRAILRWIADELGADTYVNLMDQYRPAGRVFDGRYRELNRRLSAPEFAAASVAARALGLRLDARGV